MTQKEFIEKLAAKLQWDESNASDVLEVISNIMAEQLSDNIEVSIDNFGVFSTHKNQEYILVDSDTGEHFLMPPEIVIAFKPYPGESSESAEPMPDIFFETDDSLKSNINSAFQNFEPTLINEGVEFPGIEVIKTVETNDEFEEPETETVYVIKETEETVEKTEIEEIPEIKQPPYSETEPVLKTDPEPQPIPVMQPERSLRLKPRSRKSSRVLVPVLGGVVIVMATLFFFNGVANRKSADGRKSKKC